MSKADDKKLLQAARKEMLVAREKYNRLCNEYCKKYSTYKAGDRVIIKPKYGSQQHAVIEQVIYREDSNLSGKACIICKPYTKNWKEPMQRRSSIHIKTKEEIIKND